MGSLALGFTSPKKTLATASAPLLPAYQASTTPLTWSSQGIVTAVPVSSTTMVCGFAAATARSARPDCRATRGSAGPCLRWSTDRRRRWRRRTAWQEPRLRRIFAGVEFDLGAVGLLRCNRSSTAKSGTRHAPANRRWPARGIHLRRAAAGDHAHIGMISDDGDGLDLGCGRAAERRCRS